MRIWSLHPKYLDQKGIVALWRETLLAKKVLEGKTKGYKNHPQLNRFKNLRKPVDAINEYLSEVYEEATKRGYQFDKTKINGNYSKNKIRVSTGQLKYEFNHLLKKLQTRDSKKYREIRTIKKIETLNIFEQVAGRIENWEKIST